LKKLTVFVAFMLLFLLPAPLVAAESSGSISGQVTNRTPDGGSVANLELTLETYIADGLEPEAPTEGYADSGGNFVFEGLDTDTSYTYYITAEYLGVKYYSPAINFAEDQTAITTELNVYDTTEDNSEINISMSHTIVYVESDGLAFIEFFSIDNQGNHTYTGSWALSDGTAVTARLPLPSEAEYFQLEMGIGGEYFVVTDNGLAYTAPIMPGSTTISYSYWVNDAGFGYTFNRVVDYKQSSYEFVVQGAGKIDAPQLSKNELLTIQGVIYEYFTGEDVPGGQTLTIQLSRLQPEGQQTELWTLLAFILVISIVLLVLLRRRRRQATQAPARITEKNEEKLLLQIAQLDDEFENGDTDEEDYIAQREKLKNLVLKMRHKPSNKEQKN
jgi:hypothetical protein